MSALAQGSAPAPAPSRPKARARRRARSCAPRLFAPDDAGPISAPASAYVEPSEAPVMIGTWPGRVVSWTAADWDALGAMQPTGTIRLAGGVRALFFVD